jgi:hypothetical protein
MKRRDFSVRSDRDTGPGETLLIGTLCVHKGRPFASSSKLEQAKLC